MSRKKLIKYIVREANALKVRIKGSDLLNTQLYIIDTTQVALKPKDLNFLPTEALVGFQGILWVSHHPELLVPLSSLKWL